jgi:hypothetical protein
MDQDPIAAVFRHLDAWRHLPDYQLERRADVFFSVYLKDVMESFVGVELEHEIIPELPIKCDLVRPDHPTNRSVKVDYALFAKDRSRVIFVELKTDASSRRDAQDEYLEAAQRLGFRRIVEGIRSILLKTTSHQKYHHLARALGRLGFLDLPSDLASYVYPMPRPGLLVKLAEIVVSAQDLPIEVIYVQPEKSTGDRCVSFEEFATHVEKYADPFSARFSEHLRRWQSRAGRDAPR